MKDNVNIDAARAMARQIAKLWCIIGIGVVGTVAMGPISACSGPSRSAGEVGVEGVSRIELSSRPEVWVQRGGGARYTFSGGEIIGTTKQGEPNSFLCYTPPCPDFEITLEVKTDALLNSGVQVRSQLDAGGRVYGYQVEVDPSKRAWSGGVYDEGRRGWLQTPPPGARHAFIAGAWNLYRVRCEQGRIRTWVNEVACADLTDALDPTGFIGLQVHSMGEDPSVREVRWRSVSLVCLGASAAPLP